MIERLFDVTARGSTIRQEVVAGVTTFLAMSYILFVNPMILADAAMDTGAVFVAGPNVNADLIAFDAVSSSFSGPCGGSALVNFTWTGGELDITRAHLSGTVPQGTSIGATTATSPYSDSKKRFPEIKSKDGIPTPTSKRFKI